MKGVCFASHCLSAAPVLNVHNVAEKRPVGGRLRVVSILQEGNFPIIVLCHLRLEMFGGERLINLFIWGFTSLSTLYRSYHDG